MRSMIAIVSGFFVILGCGSKAERESVPKASDEQPGGAFVRVIEPNAPLRFKADDQSPIVASAREDDVFALHSKEHDYYAVTAMDTVLWVRTNEVVRVASAAPSPADEDYWRKGCAALREASGKAARWGKLGEGESQRLVGRLQAYGENDKETWRAMIRTHHAIDSFHALGINPSLDKEVERLCLELSGDSYP